MLDTITPPVEGSLGTMWNPRVGSNTGFKGKWKEGSRARTPNVDADAGPSVRRGLPKNPTPVKAPLPKLDLTRFY
jgi:hypothetical protein